MSATDQLGDDHRSHEETIDIKTLLKLIVETQAKQEESQQQIIEILRSTNSSAGNNHKQKEEDIGENADKEEISDATTNDGNNQQAAEVEINPVAIYVPGKNDKLYEALSTNKIDTVKEILKNNPEVVKEGITHDSSTVLHTAVHWRMDIMLIEEIVKLMSPDILEYKTNKYGYTACHRASIYGYAKAAVVMVNKNPKLTQIRDYSGSTPLELALQYHTVGQKEIVEYLYSVTRDEHPSPFMGIRIFFQNDPGIRIFFQSNPDIIKVAIKHGIIEVVVEVLEQFPYLIWYPLPDQRMIGMAIAQRNELMVSLICDLGDVYGDKFDLVSTMDDDKNTILHYAAKLAPSAKLNLISGVALQMQREVQWFKVKSFQKSFW
ncbi:hypothetical protein MKX01_031412 [Papaver californicum]|nr:hypothetical protein MKX01_031412 [Papaver californicum]